MDLHNILLLANLGNGPGSGLDIAAPEIEQCVQHIPGRQIDARRNGQPYAGRLIAHKWAARLIELAGLITSLVMFRTPPFKPITAYIGLAASALDLAYCMAYVALLGVNSELLGVVFIPPAGLFWMAWHILVGWQLFRLGRGGHEGLL